ncbi:MAG TPA: glycosyltransferase family 4 protein [Methylomirabilota bacterium]|nr:glycosyltransferase family 4 protein [Methylomirabilota bacterium]
MRVIFEYANGLVSRGHRVTLVCPTSLDRTEGREPFKKRLGRWGRYLFADRRVGWFDLRAKLHVVPDLRPRHIPPADLTIATWWRTAEALAECGPQAGTPLYFVQGYEIWAGPRERVESTYRLPMRKLVVASWLRRLLIERFGQEPGEVRGPMISGVNFSLFYNDRKVFRDPPTIGMIYRPVTWRGTQDGLQAFERVRAKHPKVRLLMFGHEWPTIEAPEDVEYHRDPPQPRLREFYSSCEIWVNPSWHEGLPLPPMEAMACQSALVTTDVGVEDYVIPGVTALVVPPRDPDALEQAILRLIEDPALLQSLARAGYEHIKAFTWDKAVQHFEAELLDAVGR